MTTLPTTIVSTVGTSLLTNMQHADEPALAAAMARDDWAALGRTLRGMPAHDRRLGAEINSLTDLLDSGLVASHPLALDFCVSDTDEGRRVGSALEAYFEGRAQTVRVHVVEGLTDRDPDVFRTMGLRALVRRIGEVVARAGGASMVAINATGGFKAQMAIAVLIGQALGAPVYYKHERFDSIIAFPPMPISFDDALIARELPLLTRLEEEGVVALDGVEVEPALRVLLEETPADDGGVLWSLTPMGLIYLEGYRQRHPVGRSLPAPAAERRAPTFRDDHFPRGFRDFVEAVWRDNAFITGTHTLSYDKQRAIRDRQFYERHDGQIVGEYLDKDRFGARFAIDTTARTPAERAAVVIHLTNRYGGSSA